MIVHIHIEDKSQMSVGGFIVQCKGFNRHTNFNSNQKLFLNLTKLLVYNEGLGCLWLVCFICHVVLGVTGNQPIQSFRYEDVLLKC